MADTPKRGINPRNVKFREDLTTPVPPPLKTPRNKATPEEPEEANNPEKQPGEIKMNQPDESNSVTEDTDEAWRRAGGKKPEDK